MDLCMHMVMGMDEEAGSTPNGARNHAVLGFLFKEDPNVRDIPFFTEIIANTPMALPKVAYDHF